MENTSQIADFRLELTDDLFSEIDSATYHAGSTIKSDRIILPRKRILTLTNLIVMIIKFKTSVQRELDSFFKELSNEDFNIRVATKGAFSQARSKLNPWAFKRLNEVAVASFYKGAPYHKWHGRRVLAVDGTRFLLPNHPSVIKDFGQHGMGANGDCQRSMAIGSILYDVLNQIAIDAAMAPYASSETSLLLGHLPQIKEGDLLLLDRGYPSYWLLHLLHAQKIDFCVRLKSDLWLQVREFTKSGEKERIVSFDLPKRDSKKLDTYEGKGETPVTCRLIRIELENGEVEILCTSLLDLQEYGHEVFSELYHLRWNEEEAYKLLKSRIEIERFSGKTSLAVQQDFHAKVFLLTLTAAFAHPVAEKVAKEYHADGNRKHSQKINRTQALSMTQNMLLSVIIKKIIQKALDAFDLIVAKTREIIRPKRTQKRSNRQKKPFHMNYKPL